MKCQFNVDITVQILSDTYNIKLSKDDVQVGKQILCVNNDCNDGRQFFHVGVIYDVIEHDNTSSNISILDSDQDDSNPYIMTVNNLSEYKQYPSFVSWTHMDNSAKTMLVLQQDVRYAEEYYND